MQYNEKMLYEGYILDVLKCSFAKPAKPSFNVTKNKLNDCLEIAYYIKGHDVTRIGDKLLVNTADTIRIAPPHNQTTEVTEQKAEAAAEIIDIAVITPHSFSDKSIVINAENTPKLKELFLKIYNIWTEKPKNYFFDAMSVYYNILKEIYNLLNTEESSGNENNKIRKAVEYIQRNYSKKSFSCNILPELCGWKHAYFYKMFEKELKTTPQKYTTSLRMQLAADLLLYNKLSVSEIADRCGYESVAYFSRVFKSFYGVSPTRYSQ